MSQTAVIGPTPEQIEAALSHPDAFYEIVDGEIEEQPEMGFYSRLIAKRLADWLTAFVSTHPSGIVLIEMMFVLDPARPLKRSPDVAYLSFDRWPADREVPEQGDCQAVPDLAIEVLSPQDRDKKIARKIRDYFQYGVRRVWLIRPETGEVYVYSSPKRIEVLDGVDVLDGGDLLPGFQMPLAELFRRTVG